MTSSAMVVWCGCLMIDDFNREALCIEVDFSLPAREQNGCWSRSSGKTSRYPL